MERLCEDGASESECTRHSTIHGYACVSTVPCGRCRWLSPNRQGGSFHSLQPEAKPGMSLQELLLCYQASKSCTAS